MIPRGSGAVHPPWNEPHRIVELHNPLNGEWGGAERINADSKEALYELGYRTASQRASLKGGRVETFRQLEEV